MPRQASKTSQPTWAQAPMPSTPAACAKLKQASAAPPPPQTLAYQLRAPDSAKSAAAAPRRDLRAPVQCVGARPCVCVRGVGAVGGRWGGCQPGFGVTTRPEAGLAAVLEVSSGPARRQPLGAAGPASKGLQARACQQAGSPDGRIDARQQLPSDACFCAYAPGGGACRWLIVASRDGVAGRLGQDEQLQPAGGVDAAADARQRQHCRQHWARGSVKGGWGRGV
jgi:hypothetical protein